MSDNDWFVLRAQPADGPSKSGSPDIILGGVKPDPAYAKNYDKTFNATAQFGGANHVYVRAKNAADDVSAGSVSVYAVRQGNVANQNMWIPLKTSDGRTSTTIFAQAGAVGVNGSALQWSPGEAPPAGAPWLLIAELTGDEFPLITLPAKVTDFASFEAWAATQTRVACLIVQAPDVKPVPVPVFTWSRKVELDNADPISLAVSVACTSGSAGGSLSYQFDKNDADGKVFGIGTVAYTVGSSYPQTRTVPENFAANLTVTYTPAADDTAAATFAVQVSYESAEDDSGDMGETTTTLVINDTLNLGQVRGKV